MSRRVSAGSPSTSSGAPSGLLSSQAGSTSLSLRPRVALRRFGSAGFASLASIRLTNRSQAPIRRSYIGGARRTGGGEPASAPGRTAGNAELAGDRSRGRLGRLEREVENLSDGHHRMERHLLADVGGDVVEVGAVALGQDHV